MPISPHALACHSTLLLTMGTILVNTWLTWYNIVFNRVDHMETRRLTIPQRLIIWALVSYVVWHVLSMPVVADTVATFILTGTVPGTSIALAPETVIRLAGGLLVLIGLLLLIKPMVRAMRARKQVAKAPSTQHMYTAAASPATSPAAATISTTSATPAVSTIVPAAPAYRPPSKLREVPPAARQLIGYIQYRFIADYYVIKTDLKHFRAWATERARLFWTWAEPRLWRFDAWLGVQFHALAKAVQRKLMND